MAYYYHLDSSGEDTNLQLYSFRQAKKYWRGLEKDYAEYGEFTENFKERIVFILANLGLSISQLLGQNIPTPGEKVPYPITIFNEFIDHHGLDINLKEEFAQFNYFYNGCRHFGKTTGGEGYQKIDQMTYQVAKDCYEFGIKVWRIVINVYRQEKGTDLEEFNLDKID